MKGMKTLIRVFILVFIPVISLVAGCSQNKEPETSAATPASPGQQELQQIVSDAAFTTDEVRTYKIDLKVGMAISASNGNTITKGTVSTSIEAETDRVAHLSHANFYMSTTVEGRTESTDYSLEMFYVLPDFMYAKRTTEWMKQAYREDTVSPGAKELDELLTLYKSVTNPRFLRYETLDGTENYVVELIPDWLEATSWFLKRSVFGVDSKPEDELKNLKSLAFTVWIDKSTLLLNKVNLLYSWGYDNDTDSSEVSATVKIYDYNKPLNLTPPTETAAIPSIPATPVPKK